MYRKPARLLITALSVARMGATAVTKASLTSMVSANALRATVYFRMRAFAGQTPRSVHMASTRRKNQVAVRS